jgi:hypothetical protein
MVLVEVLVYKLVPVESTATEYNANPVTVNVAHEDPKLLDEYTYGYAIDGLTMKTYWPVESHATELIYTSVVPI